LAEQSAPLGSMRFDASHLRVSAPPSNAAGAQQPDAYGSPWDTPDHALGVASYGASATDRDRVDTLGPDFDATRIVEDFDLPDTGFETHVFSTSELVDGEPFEQLGLDPASLETTMPLDGNGSSTVDAALLGARPFGASLSPVDDSADGDDESTSVVDGRQSALAPDHADERAESADEGQPDTPQQAVASPFDEIHTVDAVFELSASQEAGAHGMVRELASLGDVVFVKLVGPRGAALVSHGIETGDITIEQHITGIMNEASYEADAQELGETNVVALESDTAALLMAPIHAGVVLAVYVSNPARLGLLRRQVRKPIIGLRSLLLEPSVS
jgi:predicted regulator of Ras-like GTPase activity (Roadblock/LC7/MglB family)